MESFDQDIQQACRTLTGGGIILYPTDTVWGLGCDATNREAVRRIYALKRRDDSKALICLTGSEEMVRDMLADPESLPTGIMTDSDRPTTVILSNILGVAENLLADDGSAGIRVTNESFSRQLCLSFGKPIVSTSANISGDPGATTYSSIKEELLKAVDYVCTSRRDETSVPAPSRIVKLMPDGNLTVIRP